MQGYLHVELDKYGVGAAEFEYRYFISFPFCGMRWYYSKPELETSYKLLVDNDIGGWVFGGNIIVVDVYIEDDIVGKVNDEVHPPMYYFAVVLECESTTRRVVFGCESGESLQDWVDEIKFYAKAKHYLSICHEIGAIPSATIFFATLPSEDLVDDKLIIPIHGSSSISFGNSSSSASSYTAVEPHQNSLLYRKKQSTTIHSSRLHVSDITLDGNSLVAIYQLLYMRSNIPMLMGNIIEPSVTMENSLFAATNDHKILLSTAISANNLRSVVLIELKLEFVHLDNDSMHLVRDIMMLTTASLCMPNSNPNNSNEKQIELHVSSLQTLSLKGNYISCSGLRILIPAITKCKPTLRKLDFSSNYLGDKGVISLMHALAPAAPNKTSKLYYLNSNSGTCYSLHTKHMREFHHSLDSLDLSHNRLTEGVSKTLVSHIAGYHYYLSNINLSYNAIGAGAAALVSLLLRHPSQRLQTVNVSYCHIPADAMNDVATVLYANISSNTDTSNYNRNESVLITLRELNISGNMLDAETLSVFIKSISEQHAYVVLHFNSVGNNKMQSQMRNTQYSLQNNLSTKLVSITEDAIEMESAAVSGVDDDAVTYPKEESVYGEDQSATLPKHRESTSKELSYQELVNEMGLKINIGGFIIEASSVNMYRALSMATVRASFMSLDNNSSCCSDMVLIRKNVFERSFDPAINTNMSGLDKSAMSEAFALQQKRVYHNEVVNEFYSNIICMKVRFPLCIYSTIYEFIDYLSILLQCDPNMMTILSYTDCDGDGPAENEEVVTSTRFVILSLNGDYFNKRTAMDTSHFDTFKIQQEKLLNIVSTHEVYNRVVEEERLNFKIEQKEEKKRQKMMKLEEQEAYMLQFNQERHEDETENEFETKWNLAQAAIIENRSAHEGDILHTLVFPSVQYKLCALYKSFCGEYTDVSKEESSSVPTNVSKLLCTVNDVINKLLRVCRQTPGDLLGLELYRKLCAIGVQTLYVQTFEKEFSASNSASAKYSIRANTPYHCHIDVYKPPHRDSIETAIVHMGGELFPNLSPVVDPKNPNSVQKASPYEEGRTNSTIDTENPKNNLNSDIVDMGDENNQTLYLSEKRLKGGLIVNTSSRNRYYSARHNNFLIAGLMDDDSVSRRRRRRKGTDNSDEHEDDDVDSVAEENARILKLKQKANEARKDKGIVSTLVGAVRFLHQNGDIALGHSAKFWEGLLGNPKYEGFTHDVFHAKLLYHADLGETDTVSEYEGLIVGVAKKLMLCDAMYSRNANKLKEILYPSQDQSNSTQFDNSCYMNSSTYVYASRLCSNIISLKRAAKGLENIVTQPVDICELEEYLLRCAVVGHSDEEDISCIVNLRTLYVKQALAVGSKSQGGSRSASVAAQSSPFYPEYLCIKQRAIITNAMLSRDIPAMRAALATVVSPSEKSPQYSKMFHSCSAEVSSCKKLLSELSSIAIKLRELVDTATDHLTETYRNNVKYQEEQTLLHADKAKLKKMKKKRVIHAEGVSIKPFSGGVEEIVSTDNVNVVCPVISSYPSPINSANIKPITTCLDILMELIEVYTLASYYCIDDNALMQQAQYLIIQLGRHPKYVFSCVIAGLKEQNPDLIALGERYMTELCHWKDEVALHSGIPMKIYDRMAVIHKQDQVRNRVIKVALAIRNGFTVNNSEVFYLTWKCRMLKYDSDPNLFTYYTTLDKHLKRHMPKGGRMVEELMVQLLEQKKFGPLSEILAGKGSGKLITSCVSQASMSEWITKLNMVGRGEYKPYHAHHHTHAHHKKKHQKPEVLFSGTMEKAARVENSEALRSWKSRYFELTNDGMLTYFTRINGDRKGSIRVAGGNAKMYNNKRVIETKGAPTVDADGNAIEGETITSVMVIDTKGRHFCVELQEGRDISHIDPDFLNEMKTSVNNARFEEINRDLHFAMANHSFNGISAALSTATELGLYLDKHVVEKAKLQLVAIQKVMLLRDLSMALNALPRGQLEALVRSVRKVGTSIANGMHSVIDGVSNNFLNKNPVYMKAVSMLDRTDVELTILRFRGIIYSYLHNDFNILSNNFIRFSNQGLGGNKASEILNQYQPSLMVTETQEFITSYVSNPTNLLFDENGFSKTLSQIKRFESSRFTVKDKKMLVNAILQKVCIDSFNKATHGFILRSNIKALKQSLAACLKYHVETEPLQLVRLLLTFAEQERQVMISDSSNRMNDDEPADTAAGMGKRGNKPNNPTYAAASKGNSLSDPLKRVDDCSVYVTDSAYSLFKYDFLRSVQHNKQVESNGSLFGAMMSSRHLGTMNAVTKDVLGFQPTELISKPLLKGLKAEESGLVEAYEVLLVIMRDRPLSVQFMKKKVSTNHPSPFHTNRSSIDALCMDLISYGVSNPIVRDELFIQVCKQLRGNPNAKSRQYGWKLMVLYLHYFAPSNNLIPFVYNCMHECMKWEVENKVICRDALDVIVVKNNYARASADDVAEQHTIDQTNRKRKNKKRITVTPSDMKGMVDEIMSDAMLNLDKQYTQISNLLKEIENGIQLIWYSIRYLSNCTSSTIRSPYFSNGMEQNNLPKGGSAVTMSVSMPLITLTFCDSSIFPIQVVSPTGSVYKFNVKLSTLTSIPNLMYVLYTKCFEILFEQHIIQHYKQQQSSHSSGNGSNGMDVSTNANNAIRSTSIRLDSGNIPIIPPVDRNVVADIVSKELRGFHLYYYSGGTRPSPERQSSCEEVQDHDAFGVGVDAEEETESSSGVNVDDSSWNSIPVQASSIPREMNKCMQQWIPWNSDLLWESLYSLVVNGGVDNASSSSENPSITFVLRKQHTVPCLFSEAAYFNYNAAMLTVNTDGFAQNMEKPPHVSTQSTKITPQSCYRYCNDLQMKLFNRVLDENDQMGVEQCWMHWLRFAEYFVGFDSKLNKISSDMRIQSDNVSESAVDDNCSCMDINYSANAVHMSVSNSFPNFTLRAGKPIAAVDRALVLPMDHIRIDLCFAEESRIVNAYQYYSEEYSMSSSAVNRSIYSPTDEAWGYVLGIQLCLAWGNPLYLNTLNEHEKSNRSRGGIKLNKKNGEIDILRDSCHSIRPCMQYVDDCPFMSTKHPSVAHEPKKRKAVPVVEETISGLRDVDSKKRLTRTNEEGIVVVEPKLIPYDNEDEVDEEIQDYYANRASPVAVEGINEEQYSEESKPESVAEESEESEEESDESSEEDNDSLDSESNYSSVESTQESEEEEDEVIKTIDINDPSSYCTYLPSTFDELQPHEVTLVKSILAKLGVVMPVVNMKTGLVENSNSFEIMENALKTASEYHSVAQKGRISVFNPRFRYMCKLAYLTYISSWEMYGCKVCDAILMSVSMPQSLPEDPYERAAVIASMLAPTIGSGGAGELDENGSDPIAKYREPAVTAYERDVMVAVSVRGIYILDKSYAKNASNQYNECLFFNYLWDIEECTVSSVDTRASVSGAHQTKRLMISVNGCKLSFLTKYADEIRKNIELSALDLTALGLYPHGTGCGSDEVVAMSTPPVGTQHAHYFPRRHNHSLHSVESNDVQTYYENGHSKSSFSGMNSNSMYKFFICEFPMLPIPPTPPSMPQSPDFIQTPKSKREILAQERAEEEQREAEQARLAQELQQEKNMASMECGRHATRNNNDDDGSDDEGERQRSSSGDSIDGTKKKKRKAMSSARRRNSGGAGIRSSLIPSELLHNRISGAVTGVPMRQSQIPEYVNTSVNAQFGVMSGMNSRQSFMSSSALTTSSSATITAAMLKTTPSFKDGAIKLDTIAVYEKVKVLEPPPLLGQKVSTSKADSNSEYPQHPEKTYSLSEIMTHKQKSTAEDTIINRDPLNENVLVPHSWPPGVSLSKPTVNKQHSYKLLGGSQGLYNVSWSNHVTNYMQHSDALLRQSGGIYHSNHIDRSRDMHEIYYPCGGVYRKYAHPPKKENMPPNAAAEAVQDGNRDSTVETEIYANPIAAVEEEDTEYVVNDD